jgi:hypothetical protein
VQMHEILAVHGGQGMRVVVRNIRKRLANCIYPVPAGVAMMSSPSIDLPRGHHESKPNQKRC